MKKKLLLAAMLFVMTITSCVPYNTGNDASDTDTSASSAQTGIVTSEMEKETSSMATTTAVSTTSVTETTTVSETTTSASTTAEPEKQTTPFSLSDIPPFSNTPYCEVNNNKPSQTYILNKNTKKIHYPWCSSVEDMAEHNKQEYTGDINEIIGQGYSPCKRCNPS